MTGGGVGELDISADGSRIWSASWSRPTPPATTTGTSTCTSAPRPNRWTWRRHDHRRPLRRHDRRREQGLLHDQGQTARRRHRRKRRPLPGGGRPAAARRSDAALHRHRAGRQLQRLRPGRERRRNNWNAVGGASPTPAASSRSPAAAASRPRTAPSTSSAPRSSTAATGRRTSRTSTSRAGPAPDFVATLEPDNPAVRNGGRRQRDASLRRLPGDPGRRLRGLLLRASR